MTRENELLRKILRGENEYWEELIGMYYEDIYRYCIYHAPDRNLAQDAVQETFLKVIRYFPNYRDRGKFRAFLYKVASNVCTDQWRKCREEEIPEDTVYLETWVEEGWDAEKNCATDRYRYYDKLITRDFDGNLLSEEVGSLYQAPDGSWWIG